LTLKLKLYHDIFDRQLPPLEQVEYLAEQGVDASYWHQLGMVRFQKLQFSEAVEAFTRAIALEAGPCEPYFHRAMALTIMGKFRDAIHDLTYVLSVRPDDFAALYNRGRLHIRLRQDQEALTDFLAAQRLDRRKAIALRVPQAIRTLRRRLKGRQTNWLDQFRDWLDEQFVRPLFS
jgi:tetratricopeptide (TPR) repeat protein